MRLTSDQRKTLRQWVFGQSVERRLWFRAQIVWGLAHHRSTLNDVAARLGTTTKTVCKWWNRFVAEGVDGLHERPRSGRPPTFHVEQRCEVIVIACDDPAHYGFAGRTCWTYDMLTDAVNRTVDGFEMSRSSVWRTLEHNALKPHRMQMWLHSPDPQFKVKVNTIVDLYLDPPKDAVVLSIDEKTGMQATERKYATQRPGPGRRGRFEYEYIRHGTQSLMGAFNIRTGEMTAQCGDTRKAEDLPSFMDDVADVYKDAKRIIVIWDNLNIHHDGPSQRWTEFNERYGGKFEFVYTPIHASWVNQIEIFFSILHRQCLKHGNFGSKEDLRQTVMDWIERWNTTWGHAFNWTFRGYPMQETAVA